jgi:hypothetical protein
MMKTKNRYGMMLLRSIALITLSLACGEITNPLSNFATSTSAPPNPVRRIDTIPADAVKMTPDQDQIPPVAASGWSQPEPVEWVNTAGGEDSPFITPDGQTLYFFFTPDINIPAQEQVGDGVTGIWMTTRVQDSWVEQRVLLADPDEPHLDGCPFVMGNWMAFCSARVGNQREIDIYTAEYKDNFWTNVQNWGEPFNQEYRVGELHISTDGNLYFGSDLPGGFGELDLWVSHWDGQTWEAPVNLGPAVNTSHSENRPFVTVDGSELWFDAPGLKVPGPSVFRSVRQPDGSWGTPEEIIWSFAGEPTLTGDGKTLYFVHHYITADTNQMIEADIYVSYRLDAE